MDHEELRDKMKKAMGGKIPPSARETWAPFLQSRAETFFMSWDWIKDGRIEQWAHDHPDLEAYDSPNGLTLEIWQPYVDKNGRPLGGLKGTLLEDK